LSVLTHFQRPSGEHRETECLNYGKFDPAARFFRGIFG
jgi:hypothetical protein